MNTTTRTRPLRVGDTPSKVTTQMRTLAADVFKKNKAMNAAKTQHDKARKELLVMMKDAGVTDFQTHARMDDGSSLLLDVDVATPTTQVIDIDVLAKLIDKKTFMSVISATRKDVVDQCGTVIADRASVDKTGTENVNVKLHK